MSESRMTPFLQLAISEACNRFIFCFVIMSVVLLPLPLVYGGARPEWEDIKDIAFGAFMVTAASILREIFSCPTKQ